MREILFRGKTDKGEWVEGNYYYDPDLEVTEITGFNYETSEEGLQREPFCKSVIPETVGQFTGLTDKNGARVFEGDIVKFIHKGKPKFNDDFPFPVGVSEPYSRNYKIEYINTLANYGLRFINGSTHFPCKQGTLSMHDCEVIGNIHDNPELLEGGAE